MAKPARDFVCFTCKRCKMPLEAPRGRVGKTQVCQYCHHEVPITEGVRQVPDDSTYRLDDEPNVPAETRREEPDRYSLDPHDDSMSEDTEQGREDESERPVVPRWPMVVGVFGFPWYLSSLVCLLQITFGAVIFGFVVAMASQVGIFGYLIMAINFTAAAVWFGYFAACGVTIVYETAAGNRRVEGWPVVFAIGEWFGPSLFVVNGLLLTGLAAYGIRLSLERWTEAPWYLMPGVMIVLFPFTLLSMLETDSIVVPFSPTVFRSIGGHAVAWLAFYLESSLVIGAAAGMLSLAHTEIDNVWIAIPIEALVLTSAIMIYFRLVGRLAWCCSVAPPETEEAEAEESEAVDDGRGRNDHDSNANAVDW